MTNKQVERRLAQALDALRPKTDFSAVAGAMPAPAATTPVSVSRMYRVRRYVAAVAAAAVMMAGVGTWWLTRPEDKPPVTDTIVTDATGNTTTTDSAADTTTTTATGTTVGTADSTDTTGSAATSATLAPTKPTTAPTQGGVTDPPEVTPVTSLKEAKAAIAAGRYEAAYLYLLTDTSKEAAQLLEKFVYVPVGKTDTSNGEVYGTGNWTYDEMGLPENESVIDESGGTKAEKRKLFTYDSQGRVKTKTLLTLKNGEELYREEYAYTYNDAGYLAKEEYNGPDTAYLKRYTKVFTYDERGNCVREELTGEGYSHVITTRTYDEANRLLLKLDSYVETDRWQKWEYVYDAAGRVLSYVHLSSGGGGWTYTYTYDQNGVQTSYSHTLPDDPDHWQKWYMDGNQKIYEEKASNTGNYKKVIYEGDKAVYAYSTNRGEISESFYNADGKPTIVTTWTGKSGYYSYYTYDKRGNCVEETRYTYTNQNAPEASSTLSYVLDSFAYVYDEDGRILEKKRTDFHGKVTTYVYAYDAAGRTIKDGTRTKQGVFYGKEYAYNDAGLLLTQKESWSDDDWTLVTNTYDQDGHKIGVERSRSDGTWTKAIYDAAGNLLRWENHKGLLYTYTWELRYYPDGLTPEHREELQAFRDAAGEAELKDESGLVDE